MNKYFKLVSRLNQHMRICDVLKYFAYRKSPIIGILSQEAYLVKDAYPDADSFIVASYIKILESSGARVLPIWIGQDAAYYQRVVNFTNGILFPGGGTYFNETGGYGEAAKQLYELAVKTNEKGVHYPVWGICLGMQVLMYGALGRDIRGDCQSKDVALPLEFVAGYEDSKLFSKASSQLLENLKTKNLTYNYHRYCIFEDVLKNNNLLKDWRIISKNKDKNGLEFVSSMEHVNYPFFGTQFHPEKNPFEFKKTTVPHCPEAVELAQYFGNFFVNEARKNNHTFENKKVEEASLIYNFNPVYSIYNTSYEQLYLFNDKDYSRKLL
ncbi:gamma-glutamyl hydrolase-like isoform X1 [Tribolium madens]|uniref:gamma-glutamyl hydrolase-like isoform X1 n=1 Tax=Tribolium madens TaxID=41895 RepID=UPI001CF71D17|nr:gamma-glutamyl hydrolase-like isoform X1 [Tribolium madens]